MNRMLSECAYFGAALTMICFEAGMLAKKKFKVAFVNPLLVAVLLIVVFLTLFKVDYETYAKGADYIGYFLTPATVSLAIPLYRKLELIRRYPKAIFGGIAIGVLTTMVSIFLMSLAFGLNHAQYATLLPKSITTAIALGVSEKIGGITALTIVSVSITGILGNMAAGAVCKIFRIEEPIAKGLAIGTASHALGTTRAMEFGEIEGAMSSLSIVVAGFMTVVVAPVFAKLL